MAKINLLPWRQAYREEKKTRVCLHYCGCSGSGSARRLLLGF